ncbi:hypothetical protein ISF6_2882 [Piscinibacter sakaiensis]|uniref:Uncharacterized protein n=1 Tax=Piscinibacter sakaiensis TaxID=1547922 RepID=A0A0K8P2X4_PISS1|nr:hypothetical protein ISF6_2882 [Piscinibacter sakaiensis]
MRAPLRATTARGARQGPRSEGRGEAPVRPVPGHPVSAGRIAAPGGPRAVRPKRLRLP